MEQQNSISPREVRIGRCGCAPNAISWAGNEGCGGALEQHRLIGTSIWQPKLCEDCQSAATVKLQTLQRQASDQERRRRIRDSGVPPLVIEALKTIVPVGKSLEARTTIDRFLASELNQRFLLVTGPKGTGKTTECGRAVVQHIEAGRKAVFANFSDLLLRIRDSFRNDRGESELSILRSVREPSLVVLDDLGANRSSQHAADTLFNVIDYRYQRAAKTIITSNYGLKELAAHIAPNDDVVTAERIVDRIRERALWIELSGASHRKAAAAAERDFTWADKLDSAGYRTRLTADEFVPFDRSMGATERDGS